MPVVAAELSIVSRRVSVMDYLFLSIFSENGFPLVSGSERNRVILLKHQKAGD